MKINQFDYERSSLETMYGLIEFSLIGKYEYKKEKNVKQLNRGNPYYLLIRLVIPNDGVLLKHGVLNSLQMNGINGAIAKITQDNTHSSIKGPGYDGLKYISFLFKDLHLTYEDYIVSGEIVLYADHEVGDIPFSVELKTKHEKGIVNSWWESLKGI